MTSDLNRFVNIQYCSGNNLPFSIMHPQGRIVNHYTLSGTKLCKMLFDRHGNLSYHEQYYGDLVISDGQPTRILHGDGTISINGSSVEYHYHLKDHLGNVRLVITPSANNKPQVLQATDYYLFRMSYTKNLSSGGSAHQPNKYLYNSKEEQEMPGKWLDYGWRMYDPQLGRWHGVDPLAEKYYPISPYAYVANNPMIFIDPDGREIWLYQYDEEGNRVAELQYTPGMEYDGDNAYFANAIGTLNQMNSVEIGSMLLGELHGSTNIFGVTNKTPTSKYALGFLPNVKGGGMSNMGNSFSLLNLAHEMFHSYQHEMGFGGRTVNNEVEANLFAASVALTYSGGAGVPGFSGTESQEGNVYMRSMFSLLYGDFSKSNYEAAIRNFFRGDTRGDFYERKGYRIAPINPLINRFYPLNPLP